MPSRLTVPLPPSVNAAYRNVPGKGRVKTKAYRSWLAEAGWETVRQRPVGVKGRVRVRVVFGKPDKRKRDLDNLLKCVFDLLTKYGLIEDDSMVVKLEAEWDESGRTTGAVIEWSAA